MVNPTGETEGALAASSEPCPHCHRPMDDIEGMDEAALLKFLRVEAMRMMARDIRSGELSAQALTALRGMLRDNQAGMKPIQPAGDEPEAAPAQKTKLRRARPEYEGTDDA